MILLSLRTGRQEYEDGKTLVCEKRYRVITYEFCSDLHSPLIFSGLLQKDLFKKGEVWRKVISTKLLSRLSQKVCRLLFSSVLLRKLRIISVTRCDDAC